MSTVETVVDIVGIVVILCIIGLFAYLGLGD